MRVRRLIWLGVIVVSTTTGCGAVAAGSSPPATGAAPVSVSTPSGAFVPGPPTKTAGCRQRGADPDPDCTPGAVNPAVTQATIHQTICVSGFTKTIRPQVAESTRLKRQSAVAYGITASLSDYEGDHLISLELGGAVHDIANFWDEKHVLVDPADGGSLVKDSFEDYLNRRVCSGGLSLAEAQRQIATGWYEAWAAAGRPRG
jgi:hypothetical protein